jgi:aspartate-semialdehyde dehydrogenase
MSGLKIEIIGAMGLVGREILSILERGDLHIADPKLFAPNAHLVHI